jgi:citrate lyase synthetase
MQFATTGGTAEKSERSVAGVDDVSVENGVHFAHKLMTKESERAYGQKDMHVFMYSFSSKFPSH